MKEGKGGEREEWEEKKRGNEQKEVKGKKNTKKIL